MYTIKSQLKYTLKIQLFHQSRETMF